MALDSAALEDEHTAFQRSVRRLARTEFFDSYLSRAASTEYPREELKKLTAAGLTSLCVAEELGGQGADLIALGLACEEVSYADPNCGYLVFGTNVAADLLATNATPTVLEEWLPRIIAGESVCCVAVTESGCGSDVSALTTRAVRVPGGWELTGEKTSVTQATHADLAVVLAQTDPVARARGIAAFLVRTDDPSVSRQSFADPGFKPLGRGSIAMDRTFVPDAYVLGPSDGGFTLMMREFDLTRTLIAFLVLGPAHRAIDSAITYSKQRETFGKSLAAYQGVSFPIAEHLTYLAAVRALALEALALRARGEPHTTHAAMLKWWAPRVAFNAINDAIVLHGQVGWSDELPLQALLRDVSGYQIGDGTPQIQKLVIARELIGREVLDRPTNTVSRDASLQ